MKLVPVVFLLFVVILSTNVFGQSKEKSCRSVVQELTKQQLAMITQCTKKMKFKNGKEKSKKQNCILRCVMIEVGLLSQEGQVPPLEEMQAFLNKFFPESLVDQANRTFTPCLDLGVKEKFLSLEEDQYCKSIDGFVKCLLGSLPNLCP